MTKSKGLKNFSVFDASKSLSNTEAGYFLIAPFKTGLCCFQGLYFAC